MILLFFLSWTFLLYFIHRIAHGFKWSCHMDHHKFILDHSVTSWKWNNLLLFNDTWLSTLDLWVTEVLPTIVFCMITGIWEIAVFYYLWASLIQEIVEHNPNFNIFPFLTSGRWHLLHHTDDKVNFGLFIPVWDLMFDTYRRLS
jgi:sterol desaturase/sphingolipid hydroxylase (fatty acid hydroxylase superfamily)